MTLNTYRQTLAQHLENSTLAPAVYKPSKDVRKASHAAVFVGDQARILTGPSNDPLSVEQAKLLASCPIVKRWFCKEGPVTCGIVSGEHVKWNPTEGAITSKESGYVEPGGEEGALLAITLSDPHQALAACLSVTTETARIFDPKVVDLDDGVQLGILATQSRSTIQTMMAQS